MRKLANPWSNSFAAKLSAKAIKQNNFWGVWLPGSPKIFLKQNYTARFKKDSVGQLAKNITQL